MTSRRKSSEVKEQQQDGEQCAPHMEALKKIRIVVRAAQRHSNWIEKQCGVTGAQLWVMQELYESPGLRVGDVAERLAIHQTTTSNLVDALVKKGYVIKARDKHDQRVVNLALSESGTAVMGRAPARARGLLPESLQQMSEKQLRDLNMSLQALLDVIGRADESFGLEPLPFTM